MKNFEKSDIINDVAFNKNKAKFLPRNEQMFINTQLKHKLLRFVDEIKSDINRPDAMTLFDGMMNDMHGKRVKDLYNYRKDGNHVVALLCSSTPPELIYAMDNHIPVSVCMGAGEVEHYADEYTSGMCTLTRSMVGFLKTGMCVFFNLADHVLASDFCPDIKKTASIVAKMTDEFKVFCIESETTDTNKIRIDYKKFNDWIDKTTDGKGLNKERFIEYCKLYSEIRDVYKSIFNLRKAPNPPLDGRNSLWIQQLFPVEEPKKLLSGLKILKLELDEKLASNIGCNACGEKKRVMLITPRIMPPFTEIFRLIENNNAIIVCEDIDMGITNINYNIDDLLDVVVFDNASFESSVRYIMEHIDKGVSSCFKEFDIEAIVSKVNDFKVDAVITYAFKNCTNMQYKTNKISELLNQRGIRSLTLQTDYLEIYEKENLYEKEIGEFLKF